MAINFIVETGDGLSNATSYMQVNEVKQYWDNFGYDYSTITDERFQQLLNKSSKLLDSTYIKSYPGFRKDRNQGLEWPRIGAYYIDGWYIQYNTIPQEIKNAVAEMVYGIVIGEATLQPVVKNSNRIIEESVKIDVIEESKKYATSIVETSSRDRVTAVQDALSRLLQNASMTGSGLPIRI